MVVNQFSVALWGVVLVMFLREFPAQKITASDGNSINTVSVVSQKALLVCPLPVQVPWELFPLTCSSHADCRLLGRDQRCCLQQQGKIRRCTKAVRSETTRVLPSSPAPLQLTLLPQGTLATPTSVKTTRAPTTTTTTKVTTTTARTTTSTTARSTTTTPKPTTTKAKTATTVKPDPDDLVCPKEADIPFQFFYIRCVKKHSECKRSLGTEFVCCRQRCVRGAIPPAKEQAHQPILGLIPRECPDSPFAEFLFESQACETDAECWPRVCCPAGPSTTLGGAGLSYCRRGAPRLDLVPATRNLHQPWLAMSRYLQCSDTPRGLNLFTRPCNSSLDCFPNLCCQEGASRVCRPPQRSLLALLATVGQRVGSSFVSLAQEGQAAVQLPQAEREGLGGLSELGNTPGVVGATS